MRFREGVLLVAVASFATVLVGCGADESRDEPDAALLSEADESRALELFQSEACMVCHGEVGQGEEGAGPALRNLAPYWNEERLMAYLVDPEGFRAQNPDFEDRREVVFELEMPASDHLSDEQRRLLARWLLTR